MVETLGMIVSFVAMVLLVVIFIIALGQSGEEIANYRMLASILYFMIAMTSFALGFFALDVFYKFLIILLQ